MLPAPSSIASPWSAPAARRAALSRYWWAAFVAALLVLWLAVGGVALLWQADQARTREGQMMALVETLRAALAGQVATLADQLDTWRRQPIIAAELERADDAALQARAASLTAAIPGALEVQLFPAAALQPRGVAAERLSYAGVELVRTSLASGVVSALEVHRVGQPDAHLAMAVAVGAPAVGVLHVRLPLDLLPAAPSSDATGFRYGYCQQVTRGVVPIETAPPAAGPPLLHREVPGTRLSVCVWPSAASPVAGLLPWLALPALLGGLALGLVLWLARASERAAIAADLAGLLALVDDQMQRRPLRPGRARLAEFAPLEAHLRQLREAAPSATSERAGHRAELLTAVAVDPDADAGDLVELDLDTDLVASMSAPAPAADRAGGQVAASLFRAYDVRGHIGSELNETSMELLGRAIGSEALARASHSILVGRDQRPSGVALTRALIAGLQSTGLGVIDLGLVPTPLVYYAATLHAEASAAIVTGSHNPATDNGIKLLLAGAPVGTAALAAVQARVHDGRFATGAGDYREDSVIDAYISAVEADVALARAMRVAVGCGHGSAGLVAARLFRALGCEVVELDCDVDPHLADEQIPDPAQPKNLYTLGDAVLNARAEIGFGFDGDGDRLGVVDANGQFVAADRVLMVLAADLLARNPGSDIVYDVKCSHHLGAEILANGGRPVMWRSGHAFLKEKLRETDAPLGGELSGHFCFADRWHGFDDAFYAAARLLEILALDPRPTDEVFGELPFSLATPELFVPLETAQAEQAMAAVMAMADRLDGVEVNTVDGLRADFDQGFGLVRATNTQPGLMFRFEGDDQKALDKIQDLFRRLLEMTAPQVPLPF